MEFDKKKFKRDVTIKAFAGVFAGILLIALVSYFIGSTDSRYQIDTNNPNLIKTQNGYKEVLTCESVVTGKEKRFFLGHRGSLNRGYCYFVGYYNDELGDYESVDVGKSHFDDFDIGDNVIVTRTVMYDENGVRLIYTDIMELVE